MYFARRSCTATALTSDRQSNEQGKRSLKLGAPAPAQRIFERTILADFHAGLRHNYAVTTCAQTAKRKVKGGIHAV
jgi:hypothetical protein